MARANSGGAMELLQFMRTHKIHQPELVLLHGSRLAPWQEDFGALRRCFSSDFGGRVVKRETWIRFLGWLSRGGKRWENLREASG